MEARQITMEGKATVMQGIKRKLKERNKEVNLVGNKYAHKQDRKEARHQEWMAKTENG